MNSFPIPPEELDGLPSSAFVAKSFTGAKLVKGFNHLVAATLAADPIVEGGQRVVFLSSDDEDAIATVADLAKQLGFAPVKLASSTRVARWCTHAAALGVSSSFRICSRRSSNR
jgi:predicted dinucleotide-binding enzyme